MSQVQKDAISTQIDRDRNYLVALSIFKSLHKKGIISECEFVQIDAFLAKTFSPSLAAKTPIIA